MAIINNTYIVSVFEFERDHNYFQTFGEWLEDEWTQLFVPFCKARIVDAAAS